MPSPADSSVNSVCSSAYPVPRVGLTAASGTPEHGGALHGARELRAAAKPSRAGVALSKDVSNTKTHCALACERV